MNAAFFTWPRCLFRRKFGARLAELESQLEAAKNKAARLEKEKSKLTIEIETVMANLDDVSMTRPHRSYRTDAAYCYRCRTFRGLCVVVLL